MAKIIIPDETDFGDGKEPIAGAMERFLNKEAEKEKSAQSAPKTQTGEGWINDKWIYVPSIDTRFAVQRTHQNLKWYDTHKQIIPQKFRMPTPSETWELIFYLKDNLSNPEHKAVYDDILKTTPENTWHGEWQNAYFSAESEKMYVQHVKAISSNGELEMTDKVELIDYLKQDGWADITLKTNISEKGLCKVSSDLQNYNQDKNIYYWYPRDKSVVRFDADSDRASLNCYRDPSDRYSSLGVRLCAEGAQKIK